MQTIIHDDQYRFHFCTIICIKINSGVVFSLTDCTSTFLLYRYIIVDIFNEWTILQKYQSYICFISTQCKEECSEDTLHMSTILVSGICVIRAKCKRQNINAYKYVSQVVVNDLPIFSYLFAYLGKESVFKKLNLPYSCINTFN